LEEKIKMKIEMNYIFLDNKKRCWKFKIFIQNIYQNVEEMKLNLLNQFHLDLEETNNEKGGKK